MHTPRVCHFCRLPVCRKKSREHVFPRWLLRLLHSSRIRVDATRFTPDGTPLSVRSHGLDEFVLGGVCRACNHGWMSLLESNARPALEALVTGLRSVRDLSCEDRSTIARWATKTAAVLNLATDFERLFTQSLVWAIKDDPLGLPPGVFVFGAQHRPSCSSCWLQTRSVEFFLPRDVPPSVIERANLTETGFRIGLQCGSLGLVVVYWPQPQWPLAIWPELHEALWPPHTTFAQFEHWYDGEDRPWDVDSHLFLYRALDTIGAVSLGMDRIRLAKMKNRAPHVSGPEPPGKGRVLPIPDLIPLEADRYIRDWLTMRQQNAGKPVPAD
jgi:hypothetical protein